jgi:hypothetical protein
MFSRQIVGRLNAQIAARCALTSRLLFLPTLTGVQKTIRALVDPAAHVLTTIQSLIRFIQKKLSFVQKIPIDRIAWLRLCDFRW